MKKHEITVEQFARWSFERDRAVGEFNNVMTWNRLSQKDRDIYLGEAQYYMTISPDDWPEDILVRLEEATTSEVK